MNGIETKAIFAVMAAVLAAFGITAPLPDFLAAMFLAIAGSYGAMVVTPPSSRLSFRMTIFLGWLFGLVAGIAHGATFLQKWPIHLVMFAAGFLSRYLASAMVAYGKALKDRFADAAGNLKLPGEGGDRHE